MTFYIQSLHKTITLRLSYLSNGSNDVSADLIQPSTVQLISGGRVRIKPFVVEISGPELNVFTPIFG